MKYTGKLYAKFPEGFVEVTQTAADVDELADACRDLIEGAKISPAESIEGLDFPRRVDSWKIPSESAVLRAHDILNKFKP